MGQATVNTGYDSFQDTGIPWLGAIPSHWELLRKKYLFIERVQKGFSDEPLLAATQSQGVVRKTDYEARTVEATKDFHLLKLVKEGDFVISLRSFEGGIEYAHYQGIISPAYTILIPRNQSEAKFYRHFLKSPQFIQCLKLFVTGIREGQNIDYTKLSRAFLPCPPLDECERIANFLDQKTAEIDTAIAKKQRLIELLKEQKAILINQAVTKGLNPDVPMRDSGVEWIGEVPEHWDVIRLKHLYCEVADRTKSGEEELLSLRMHAGLVPHNDVSDKPITDAELVGYKLVVPGQMVMNRMRASIGLFAVVKNAGLVSPDYAVFDVDSAINASYYLALFKTTMMGLIFRLNSKGLGTGASGFMRLYTDNFGRIKVPFPPKEEQEEISVHIKKIAKEFGVAEQKVASEIDLMNELRSTVISHAVTGKIKL